MVVPKHTITPLNIYLCIDSNQNFQKGIIYIDHHVKGLQRYKLTNLKFRNKVLICKRNDKTCFGGETPRARHFKKAWEGGRLG